MNYKNFIDLYFDGDEGVLPIFADWLEEQGDKDHEIIRKPQRKPRKLKASWSLDLKQDLRSQHMLDLNVFSMSPKCKLPNGKPLYEVPFYKGHSSYNSTIILWEQRGARRNYFALDKTTNQFYFRRRKYYNRAHLETLHTLISHYRVPDILKSIFFWQLMEYKSW